MDFSLFSNSNCFINWSKRTCKRENRFIRQINFNFPNALARKWQNWELWMNGEFQKQQHSASIFTAHQIKVSFYVYKIASSELTVALIIQMWKCFSISMNFKSFLDLILIWCDFTSRFIFTLFSSTTTTENIIEMRNCKIKFNFKFDSIWSPVTDDY
jgi:hypothetical protein